MRVATLVVSVALLLICPVSGALAREEMEKDTYQPGVTRDMELGTDRPGMDYRSFDLKTADPGICRNACERDKNCRAWTFVKPGVQGESARCWLKTGVPSAVNSGCCISGVPDSMVRIDKKDATPIQLPSVK